MIDIHSHILPEVDDGSSSSEQSLSMLNELSKQGVTHLILTPHRRGEYNKSNSELKSAFEEFEKLKNEKGIPVNLYLGQEIHYSDETVKHIKENKVLTLNGGKYILLEFSYNRPTDVSECVYEIKRLGYIPVIAHVERYGYLTVDDVKEIKSVGGLIQLNADSVSGGNNGKYKKVAKILLKNRLVDFIASDLHSFRKCDLDKAYFKVCKKYGKDFADALFFKNAEKIIEG